jgi:hypothetical protein
MKNHTKIYLSENYFFVGRHCNRPQLEKGVGGYMKEVKWSQPKKKTEEFQRVTACVEPTFGIIGGVEAHLFLGRVGRSL